MDKETKERLRIIMGISPGFSSRRFEEVVELFDTRLKETEKAFGGCKNCYGKGYSTHESATIGYEDFGGEGFKHYEHRMIFCQCPRGKQLEAELSTPKEKTPKEEAP